MKKLIEEFKTFIKRGNVVDLAVGVIIGGAFSGIVNALTNQILMPFVNFIIMKITGGRGMEGAVWFLSKVEEGGVVDMAKSIYIDFGAFLTAIINFFIIAIVLFFVVKTVNKMHDVENARYFGFTKEEYFKMRLEKKKRKDIQALAKIRDEQAEKEKAEKEAEEKRKAEEPTKTEKLLQNILEELKKDK